MATRHDVTTLAIDIGALCPQRVHAGGSRSRQDARSRAAARGKRNSGLIPIYMCITDSGAETMPQPYGTFQISAGTNPY
jgi:hypothetical protein